MKEYFNPKKIKGTIREVLEMMINKELSLKLKKKYCLEQGLCYANTLKLYESNEVDSYVLGYMNNGKAHIRHAWGLKDNRVIDATIDVIDDAYMYEPLFSFDDKDELIEAITLGDGIELFAYDVVLEEIFLEEKNINPVTCNNPLITERYWLRALRDGMQIKNIHI